MKIEGSAFSRRGKQEELAEHGVPQKPVSLGTLPKSHIAQQQKYIGSGAARRNRRQMSDRTRGKGKTAQSARAGMSRGRRGETSTMNTTERVLNYKHKPREP